MASLTDYPDDWEDTFLSNPNFSVVEYMSKMSEYQRLLKEKQDADDTSGMSGGSEGAGVRSDQLYDSAGKPKGWGGGAFSPTEMSTGDPEEVAKTHDQWGNEVDMGNRKWGIALNKALPSIVNLIPGYNVVKSINDSLNKTSGTTPGILQTASSFPTANGNGLTENELAGILEDPAISQWQGGDIW